MDIRPIKTDKDHRVALDRIDKLMDARPGTREGDELDVLATLTASYEEQRFPIDAPDPVSAIAFRMQQLGHTRKDLEPYFGTRGRVSEVLNRKRGLSLRQIRLLHNELKIPLESLIGKD